MLEEGHIIWFHLIQELQIYYKFTALPKTSFLVSLFGNILTKSPTLYWLSVCVQFAYPLLVLIMEMFMFITTKLSLSPSNRTGVREKGCLLKALLVVLSPLKDRKIKGERESGAEAG